MTDAIPGRKRRSPARRTEARRAGRRGGDSGLMASRSATSPVRGDFAPRLGSLNATQRSCDSAQLEDARPDATSRAPPATRPKAAGRRLPRASDRDRRNPRRPSSRCAPITRKERRVSAGRDAGSCSGAQVCRGIRDGSLRAGHSRRVPAGKRARPVDDGARREYCRWGFLRAPRRAARGAIIEGWRHPASLLHRWRRSKTPPSLPFACSGAAAPAPAR
jgi:hypothetical protein